MMSGKTKALTRRTLVGKVISLLFNTLSRLVITFLPRSKCILISWLQSPSEVILETPKIKSVTVSIVSPFIFHEVMGSRCHDLKFHDSLYFYVSVLLLHFSLVTYSHSLPCPEFCSHLKWSLHTVGYESVGKKAFSFTLQKFFCLV